MGGCNSSQYGYSMGGYATSPTYSSLISRILFPFDSGTASDIGSLSSARYGSECVNSSICGYCGGGYDLNYYSQIEKLSFPFDSGITQVVGNLAFSGSRPVTCDTTDFNGLFD